MCSTCGCGKPKDKHGMKTIKEANEKYSKTKKKTVPKKKDKK